MCRRAAQPTLNECLQENAVVSLLLFLSSCFYPRLQALEFANGLIMLKKKKLLIKCRIIKLATNKSKKQILAFI